jgi:hypothetical protein
MITSTAGGRPVARIVWALAAAAAACVGCFRLPTDEWTPRDLEDVAHFTRALRAADEAWALTVKSDAPWQPGDPPVITNGSRRPTGKNGPRWLVADHVRPEFAGLMFEASQQAKMCRKNVLRRLHPNLPEHFNDFILVTDYIATHVDDTKPAPRYASLWQRWSDWYLTHASDFRMPAVARP